MHPWAPENNLLLVFLLAYWQNMYCMNLICLWRGWV